MVGVGWGLAGRTEEVEWVRGMERERCSGEEGGVRGGGRRRGALTGAGGLPVTEASSSLEKNADSAEVQNRGSLGPRAMLASPLGRESLC